MYNLSDKLVISCEVTLLLQGQDGEELERLIYRAHALEGRPRSVFPMVVPVEESLHPTGLEVIIEKVWYDDNDVWRRGKGALCEYTSNALPNGRNRELLRFGLRPGEELGEEDKRTVERARRIQQFFSQPFSVAEQFTGLEGRYVKLEDTLRSFETILGGELDKYPEAAFSNVGNVDEVIAKAKKMGAV